MCLSLHSQQHAVECKINADLLSSLYALYSSILISDFTELTGTVKMANSRENS